jgi:hypothetical protein
MPLQKNLKNRIDALRKTILDIGGEYVPRDETFEFAEDMDRIIAVVRESILPHDPAAARDLMADFIRRDNAVFEFCSASSCTLGELFREATELFSAAARAANDPGATLEIVRRLLPDDNYGVRGCLINDIPRFLDKPHREALLAGWWKAVEKGPGDKRGYLFLIRQLAEACHDPVLYERALSYDEDLEDSPGLALLVAEQYFLKKKFSEALERLPAISPAHIQDEVDQIRVDCLKKLGRKEEWREVLRARVLRTAEYRHLREFLVAISPRERKAAEKKILRTILTGDCSPFSKARLFLDSGDAGTCSRIVLANPLSIEERLQAEIERIVRKLEASHPLAATSLYRQLAETILSKVDAKLYRQAVRHLRSLEALAPRIHRWKPLASHAQYVAELRIIHRRKSSLWKLWTPKTGK